MAEYRREKSVVCPGFEVDTDGVVYGRRGNPLKCKVCGDGYFKVGCIMPDGKLHQFYIHRLVAIQFLEQPEGCNYVNHKNGIKTDNRLDNLEWVTPKQNSQHSIHVLGHVPFNNLNLEKPVKGYNKFSQVYFPSISSAGQYLTELFGYKNGATAISQAMRLGSETGGYYWSYITQDEYAQHKDDKYADLDTASESISNIVYKREQSKVCSKFEVDTQGIVYGKFGRQLRGYFSKDGYLQVMCLMPDGKRHSFLIHRLIAIQFIEQPEGYTQVRHKNGIKTDNRVENLEWVLVQQA